MNQQRATIIINRTPEEARQQHDDFMRLHVGKSAFDVMMDDIARRNQAIADFYNTHFGDSKLLLQRMVEVITSTPLNIISNDDKLRRAEECLAHALQRLIKRVTEPTALQNPTHEITLSGAINRILFSHFARDNTSQIDSTAQNV